MRVLTLWLGAAAIGLRSATAVRPTLLREERSRSGINALPQPVAGLVGVDLHAGGTGKLRKVAAVPSAAQALAGGHNRSDGLLQTEVASGQLTLPVRYKVKEKDMQAAAALAADRWGKERLGERATGREKKGQWLYAKAKNPDIKSGRYDWWEIFKEHHGPGAAGRMIPPGHMFSFRDDEGNQVRGMKVLPYLGFYFTPEHKMKAMIYAPDATKADTLHRKVIFEPIDEDDAQPGFWAAQRGAWNQKGGWQKDGWVQVYPEDEDLPQPLTPEEAFDNGVHEYQMEAIGDDGEPTEMDYKANLLFNDLGIEEVPQDHGDSVYRLMIWVPKKKIRKRAIQEVKFEMPKPKARPKKKTGAEVYAFGESPLQREVRRLTTASAPVGYKERTWFPLASEKGLHTSLANSFKPIVSFAEEREKLAKDVENEMDDYFFAHEKSRELVDKTEDLVRRYPKAIVDVYKEANTWRMSDLKDVSDTWSQIFPPDVV